MRIMDFVWGKAPSTGSSRSTAVLWLIWIVWLLFIIPGVLLFLGSSPGPLRLVASLAGATLFVAIYLRTNWLTARGLASPTPPPPLTSMALWAPIVALLALALALTLPNDAREWGVLFIFTAVTAAGRLPLRQALGAIAVVELIIAFSLLSAILGRADQALITNDVSGLGLVAFASACTISLVRAVSTSRDLQAARAETSRLAAVTEERLRIARDLHDLLGHNLSLIALKSELARRLVSVAPERAAAEIGDIESVARTALQEVREAVAGYRQPSLAGELAGAREILAAADIAYRYEGDESAGRGLPAVADAVLAWAVREGVTNVIRHSHAHSCIIRVTQETREASVEITDGGTGPADLPGGSTGGHGLRGLTERVAALGGLCESGPRASGGFRLYVRVPLERASRAEQTPAAVATGTPAAATGGTSEQNEQMDAGRRV
jgi:two-component system sensor histidine kinase DesK